MTLEQLKIIVGQMESLEQQYPNCRIEFNPERKLVEILQDIPKSTWEIAGIEKWAEDNMDYGVPSQRSIGHNKSLKDLKSYLAKKYGNKTTILENVGK